MVLEQEIVAAEPKGTASISRTGHGDWYLGTLKNSKVERQIIENNLRAKHARELIAGVRAQNT